MSNEEDECDSSSLFPVASQSDITSFLHAQAAKITGLNSNISDNDDDDENSMDSITKISNRKSYLSQSCFASFSNSLSQKQTSSDDLTELKWLNTFKLKEFKINLNELKEKSSQQINKLIHELKIYNNQHLNTDSISYGVSIFLALYSKRNDQQTPWLLTIKQLYEYIQINFKQITTKRGWKNSLKQTLNTIPCFIQPKCDINKSRSIWTIDPYYRPLLIRAYLTLQSNKNINRSLESIVNNFAPKATVKTKALPRLYERLCEEKQNNEDEDEADSNNILKHQYKTISDRKRPRSTSSSGYRQCEKDKNDKRLSSSSSSTIKLNKQHKIQNHRHSDVESKILTSKSTIITPCPSIDHIYLNLKEKQKKSTEKSIKYNELSTDEDDECDSHFLTHSNRKSTIITRAQTIAFQNIKNDSIHRRKSSLPRKRLSLILPLHRANTRMNKKIIEQDLELLRQANTNQQPLDLSNRSTSIEDVLDLSLS